MRIVVLCHTAGMAGAELAIAESIKAMRLEGHEIYVVVPEEGPFLDHVRADIAGYRVIAQDHWTGVGSLTAWQKAKFFRGFYRSARAVRSYLKELRADLALTNTSTILAGALGAAWAGVPHVWYVHEFVVEDHGLTWQYGQAFSYKLMDRLSRSIVVNSLAVKEKLMHFMKGEKLFLVYCATEIDWAALEESELPEKPVLLMAGAISAGKKQVLAVQALAQTPLKEFGVTLRIVGSGPVNEKERLMSKVEKLGVSVEILPFMRDRREVFKQGRALVVASRSEAFGRVVVEAQKSGLPVLMADAGAAREVVADGETGLLFRSDDAQDLAEKAAMLFANPDLYVKLRAHGLAEANRRFSLQSHWQQLRTALRAANPEI